MKNTVGEKLKQFRSNFGMSHSQISKMLGNVSHSTFGYWEKSGAPVERLAEVAKLTDAPKKTFEWLTSTKGGKMPVLQLVDEIPAGGGAKTKSPKRSKKKKKPAKRKSSSKGVRRTFTDQDRANILADLARHKLQGDTIATYCKRFGLGTSMTSRWAKFKGLPKPNGAAVPGIVEATATIHEISPPATIAPTDARGRRVFTPQDRANILADLQFRKAEGQEISLGEYCKEIGIVHSVVRRWMTMELPAPNGAAVPGVVEENVNLPAQSAADFTNLPTEPIEHKKPGPKPGTPQHGGHGGYRAQKIPKPKALITSQYQCPHCGHPVFLPEE